MNRMVDIFAELGRRLASFGNDPHSMQCISHAVEANRWFTPNDIVMAVDAIRSKFLDGDRLDAWLGRYAIPANRRRVAIVMAGNIPLVGFFDMMCVLACGYEAAVKTSSKDSVMMEYIIDLLRDISPNIPISAYDVSQPCDMAIATGGDTAATYFRTRYASIPALIRGSRHSVAVLDGREPEPMIDALQHDVFSYGGLGCRNVSLIFLPHGTTMPLRPCPPQNTPRKNSVARIKALLAMNGTKYVDLGSCAALESRSFPDTACCVNYSFYDDKAEVEEWLHQHDNQIQCVVSNSLKHARCCRLGQAQYPSLTDYADGVDVMEFLTQQ